MGWLLSDVLGVANMIRFQSFVYIWDDLIVNTITQAVAGLTGGSSTGGNGFQTYVVDPTTGQPVLTTVDSTPLKR
ncbi:MAG: hypothetical protein LBV61_11000 [Burkholderiaceae bacterium]|jgi:hypothetical protein|nr:hypothetical protein [Burkholderiaceae bacterium]